MLKINDVSGFMIKTSFDIPTPKNKKPKKYIIVQDNLFFSIYSKVNNMDHTSYDMSEYNDTNEKIKIAEKLEKIKFKNKENIINNLVYDKVIHLETMNMICLTYRINVIYVKERTYVKMFHNNETNEVIYINDKGHYLGNDYNVNELLEINLEKPLRSVSFYKLSDLQNMATKLHIDIEKKKKQELYDSIKMVLSSIYKIE